jgi:hypothetical protein
VPRRGLLSNCARWFLKPLFWVPKLMHNIVFHVCNVFRLVARLYYYVSRGTRLWVVMFTRLLIYTAVMMRGWLHLCWYWLFSAYVVRNVEYGLGQKFRNVLDIYLPISYHNNNNSRRHQKKYPVIILVSGGAWIIGSWNAVSLMSCSSRRAFVPMFA